MGAYDDVCGMQVKAGPCEFEHYGIGDRVPLEDGLYLCPDGAFVVKYGIVLWCTVETWEEGADGKFVQTGWPRVFDKWGTYIYLDALLEERSPVAKVLEPRRISKSEAEYETLLAEIVGLIERKVGSNPRRA